MKSACGWSWNLNDWLSARGAVRRIFQHVFKLLSFGDEERFQRVLRQGNEPLPFTSNLGHFVRFRLSAKGNSFRKQEKELLVSSSSKPSKRPAVFLITTHLDNISKR